MIYIRGIGCISPLSAGINQLPQTIDATDDLTLTCQEPEYQHFIDPRMLRRMARIIKMGVAASKIALTDAGVDQPGAIITGTGLGCSEDTNKFMQTIITDQETLLSPTAFIKSTHNTIAGQIALLLENNSYNMTYAHRGFSFESALLDALLLLKEGEAENVLVGGLDELTGESTKLLQQIGCIKAQTADDLPKGGEGASFFLISRDAHPGNYASIEAVNFSYNDSAEAALSHFLEQSNTQAALVLCGAYNDETYRRNYQPAIANNLPNATPLWYKHITGEFFTSSAIACWLAAMILKEGKVPTWLVSETDQVAVPQSILIYNQSAKKGHSFTLLKKC